MVRQSISVLRMWLGGARRTGACGWDQEDPADARLVGPIIGHLNSCVCGAGEQSTENQTRTFMGILYDELTLDNSDRSLAPANSWAGTPTMLPGVPGRQGKVGASSAHSPTSYERPLPMRATNDPSGLTRCQELRQYVEHLFRWRSRNGECVSKIDDV